MVNSSQNYVHKYWTNYKIYCKYITHIMLQAQKYMILYLHHSHYRAHISTKNNYVYIYLFSFSLSLSLSVYVHEPTNVHKVLSWNNQVLKTLHILISQYLRKKGTKVLHKFSPGTKLAQVSMYERHVGYIYTNT